LSVLWVAYATHSTLKPVTKLGIMNVKFVLDHMHNQFYNTLKKFSELFVGTTVTSRVETKKL